MNNPIKLTECKDAAGFLAAKELILEYIEWLSINGGEAVKATLFSQKFDKEIDSLPVTYGYPDGGLVLAYRDDKAIGVAGIKRFNDKECEVKRMYVQTGNRGLGIGKLLLVECIAIARKLNYETIKLDTADFMKSAIRLYTDHGFVEIAAYRHNPHAQARYFELVLKNSSKH